MTTQFNRRVTITIETLDVKSLDVAFSVTRSLKPEPNTAEIQVWNLNEDHRSQIEQLKTATVQVEAGYENDEGLIFLGDLRTSGSVKEGPDWVTRLGGGDGEKSYRSKKIVRSFAPLTPISSVVREIAKALQVDLGNVDTIAAALEFKGAGRLVAEGITFAEPARQAMTRLMRSADLEWSIQNGQIQVLERGKPLTTGTAVRLAANTGLIGSPTADNDGVVSARALLNPGIVPGRILVLETRAIEGAYRAEQVTYTGDTFGNDWYVDVEASPF